MRDVNEYEELPYVEDELVYDAAQGVVDVGLENFFAYGDDETEAANRLQFFAMERDIIYNVGSKVRYDGEQEGTEASYQEMVDRLDGAFLVKDPSTAELEDFAKKIMTCWMDDCTASRNGS